MKINKIIYWAVTILAAIMFTMSGIMDILQAPQLVEVIVNKLGYPPYFLTIIGVAKVLGVVALLVPRFPRLKEWAYAGLSFNMLGALWSHLAIGDAAGSGGSIFLLLLIATSYYFYRRVQPASEFKLAVN
jgi:uncharacterized membrane protein YphA (DoxX/SURF4 family)